MSVRRRAVKARMERNEMNRRQYAAVNQWLEKVSALVERKMLAGESTVTVAELSECFREGLEERK